MECMCIVRVIIMIPISEYMYIGMLTFHDVTWQERGPRAHMQTLIICVLPVSLTHVIDFA